MVSSFQIVVLPVALYLAGLTRLTTQPITPADVQEACRGLLKSSCHSLLATKSTPSTEGRLGDASDASCVLDGSSEAALSSSECKALQSACKHIDGFPRPLCRSLMPESPGGLGPWAMKKVCGAVQTALSGTLVSKHHFQAVETSFCHKETLREIADSGVYLEFLKELRYLEVLPQGVDGELHSFEASAKAGLSWLILAYETTRDKALQGPCWCGHVFVLALSMIRVQAMLLAAGLIRDALTCLAWCVAKTLRRCLEPLAGVICCITSTCSFLFRCGRRPQMRPPAPMTLLRAEPVSQLPWTVRQRTRAALEALARSAEAPNSADRKTLARLGLQPADMRHHAAELSHIQENCFPMRDLHTEGAWWLAADDVTTKFAETESVVLAAWPRQLCIFDAIRFCGVLLPLPCSNLFAERCREEWLLPAEMPVLFSVVGVCCACFSGLFQMQPQHWHPSILRQLSHSCVALGIGCATFDCDLAVLSAALLASVDLRTTNAKPDSRGRVLLSSSFAVGHVLGSMFESIEAPSWTFVSDVFDGNFELAFDSLSKLTHAEPAPQVYTTGSFLACALSLLLLRQLPRLRRLMAIVACTCSASLLLLGALAVLMPSGEAGIVMALWWLAVCECMSAASVTHSSRLCLAVPPAPAKLLSESGPLWKAKAARGGA